MHRQPVLTFLIVAVLSAHLAACQSTYYAVWEKLGKEKRDLLSDQIEKARDDQAQASEQFKDALTRLKEMYGISGGDLEKMYDRLSADYEDIDERVALVDERIGNVQRLSADLFAEWRKEIDEIANPDLKSKSRQKLKATQARYANLEKAMLTARKSMTPVLATLKDHVLYLKHNLNAQAIGALKGEVAQIESDIDLLVLDIRNSVKAADAFLAEYGS